MKQKISCEIEYLNSPHLNQIYVGFEMLRNQGLIKLKYIKGSGHPLAPVIKVIVNKNIKVYYDTLDGLNWINGNLDDNLDYFSKINADFYFKRSFTSELNSVCKNVTVYPLGFNYFMHHNNSTSNFEKSVKNYIKNSSLFNLVRSKKKFFHENRNKLEKSQNLESQIIFFTRLWEPKDAKFIDKNTLDSLNFNRIKTIENCRKEFGKSFIGGLEESNYANRLAPSLVVNKWITNRGNYLNNLKKSNICVATTGLHNSVGWKFGEYIANSKAIVSQPLNYLAPGPFKNNINYLEFNNQNELLEKLNILLINRDFTQSIMTNNHYYYSKYLRADKLILNSLEKIIE